MQDLKYKTKNDYARSVCLFLAEGLRTRKLTLRRAYEIAEKIVQNLNLIDNEKDFLKLIKELSKDFEELLKLEDRVSFYIKNDERVKMELAVKEFVVRMITNDAKLALALMEDALADKADLNVLKAKYPGFKKYLEVKT